MKTVAAFLCTVAVLASCDSAQSHNPERDTACGTIDMADLQKAIGTQRITVEGSDTGSGEPSNLAAGKWECRIYMPIESQEPSDLGFGLELSTGASWWRLALFSAGSTSIDNQVDGAMLRSWNASYGQQVYLTFPCVESRDAQAKRFTLRSAGGTLDDDTPSYREIGSVYVLAANAIRKELGCEGEPYPLPDSLPDGSPRTNPLTAGDRACDTFTYDEVAGILPGAANGSTTWNAWTSPGDDFPTTTCQLWRKHDPTIDGDSPETGDLRQIFGPMVAFSRVSGHVAEQFDVRWPYEAYDDATPWNRYGGKGAIADNEMRLKRTCRDETHVYVGAYAPHTVSRAQYEKLCAQWVRAQAQRDGCPVT